MTFIDYLRIQNNYTFKEPITTTQRSLAIHQLILSYTNYKILPSKENYTDYISRCKYFPELPTE